MRTKTLLVTAALSVAAATSWAQVYSVNAVGYVNVTVPTGGGLAILANPLNGTNNEANTILPLADDAIGTQLYRFDVPSQNYLISSFFGSGVGWLPNDSIAPGEGFFIAAASLSGSPTLALTFVGEVPQGHLVGAVPAAPLLGLISSIVPQSASLGDEATAGTLGFPAEVGDQVYRWDVAGQTYSISSYFGPGIGWLPDPVVAVAEGFFIQKGAGTTKTQWVRDFSVN